MKRSFLLWICFALLLTGKINAQGSSGNIPATVKWIKADGSSGYNLMAGKSVVVYRSYITWTNASILTSIPPHTQNNNPVNPYQSFWSSFQVAMDQLGFINKTVNTTVRFYVIPFGTTDFWSAMNGGGDTTIAFNASLGNPQGGIIYFSKLTVAIQNILNGNGADLIIGVRNSDENNSSNFISCTDVPFTNLPINLTASWNSVTVTLSRPTYVEPGSGGYYTVSNVLGSYSSSPDQSYSGYYPQGGDVAITAFPPTGNVWATGWTDGWIAPNPRVINPVTSITLGAIFKEHLVTNTQSATGLGNQRKVVREYNGGPLDMVYSSYNEIWVISSTDGGSTWSGEKQVSGSGSASNPAIASAEYGDVYIVWQEIVGSTKNLYVRISVRKHSDTSFFGV